MGGACKIGAREFRQSTFKYSKNVADSPKKQCYCDHALKSKKML